MAKCAKGIQNAHFSKGQKLTHSPAREEKHAEQETVISWGIWASQKLSGGTLQDLIELQDPKILGYLHIFGSYFKPRAYC